VIGVSGPLEYEFQGRTLPDGPLEVTQPYSSASTYAWNTTGFPAGKYEFRVNVRTPGTTSTVGTATLPTALTSAAF